MDVHQNARLTPYSREQLAKLVLHQGKTLSSAAAQFKVSLKTARKWVRPYQSAGASGLRDRSSRPHRLSRLTPPELLSQVEPLRRQRWTGQGIASYLRLSPATISRILRRLHLNRYRDLQPTPPLIRYEHPHPGDLLHLDIKKLGRIGCVGHRIHGDRRQHVKRVGWEYVHVALDDHSRIAFSQVLPNQKGDSAAAFLAAALAYYTRLGITLRALLTDHGPCYKSRALRSLVQQHGLKHRRTRPYTPRHQR